MQSSPSRPQGDGSEPTREQARARGAGALPVRPLWGGMVGMGGMVSPHLYPI